MVLDILHVFTSFFAVLNDVAVDTARSDFLWRTPLECAGSVCHIIHREANGLAGGGWERQELINTLIPSVNGMGGRLSSLKMSIVWKAFVN